MCHDTNHYSFLMFFRDVQCALHNDRKIEKLMLILREREKYSSFVFQQESDQFELCLTCKLKMTGFNGACIKCTVFSPFVYI